MKELDTINDLRSIIHRKTPSILFFNDPSDEENQKIIQTIEGLCKIFPYVICYKMDWILLHLHTLVQSNYHSHFVYKYKKCQLDMVASGEFYSELYQLFNYTFQECMHKFRDSYIHLIMKEKDLSHSMASKVILYNKKINFDITRPTFTAPPSIRRRKSSRAKKIGSVLNYIETFENMPFSVPWKISENKPHKANQGEDSGIIEENFRMGYVALQRPNLMILNNLQKGCPIRDRKNSN